MFLAGACKALSHGFPQGERLHNAVELVAGQRKLLAGMGEPQQSSIHEPQVEI